MRWFNNKKTVLENFSYVIPVLNLAFIIFAYLHTIHPIFSKEEELSKLKRDLDDGRTKIVLLEGMLDDLTVTASNSLLKIDKLEKTLFEYWTEDQVRDYTKRNRLILYSQSDVIRNYLNFENRNGPQRRFNEHDYDLLEAKDLRLEYVDVNGDMNNDIFVTVPRSFCGSGGCTGPLYLNVDDSFCLVAWTHSKTLRTELDYDVDECLDIFSGIDKTPWLSDMPVQDKTPWLSDMPVQEKDKT